MSVRTLNLIWEERVRGSYPVTAYALGNDGNLTRAIPRPAEVRAYDLTRIDLGGERTPDVSFSTQTLTEIEVTAESRSFLGMTAKEVYLFHNGTKTQFLGDRHIVFIDTALSADGKRIVVAYSDMAGISFEVACGEIEGQLRWARNVATSLNAVAISRDGNYMAYGTEAGTVALLDYRQREDWQFLLEEPVRTLACDETGKHIIYGTAFGKIGCISVSGERTWEIGVAGEIVGVATSADGSVTAALSYVEIEDASHLYCLTGEGTIALDMPFPKPLKGLSVSGNGLFVATGFRDGTAQVYEVQKSETGELAPRRLSRNPKKDAEALFALGEWEQACRILREAIKEQPANLPLFDLYTSAFNKWLETQFAVAHTHFETKDFASAVGVLEAMHTEAPKNVTILSLLQQANMGLARQWMEHAQYLLTQKDEDGAAKAYTTAIELQPNLREPRERLQELNHERALHADQRAEAFLQQENYPSALSSWEQAQLLVPSPERAAKIEKAQIAFEFATGMENYNLKQYPQAIFQFQKVLARDPEHTAAKRFLQFSQRFTNDTATETVQSRFSMLE